MNLTDTERALRKIIRETLGMPENSVKPSRSMMTGDADTGDPFATVQLVTMEPTGFDDVRFTNPDNIEQLPGKPVNETIRGQRKVLVSVQFFNLGAKNQAYRLVSLLQGSGTLLALEKAGLGLIRASPVRDLAFLQGLDWKERVQVDLEFNLIAKETLQTPTFGHFPVVINTTLQQEVHEP